MKRLYTLLLIGLGVASLASYRSWADSPRPNNPSFTSQQVEVYGDFIESFSRMNFKFLSNRTFPLELASLGKDASCLQGLQLEAAPESSKAVHSIGQEVLRGRLIHLVSERQERSILKQRDADPATPTKDASGTTSDPGILALSEVVFDKSHRFAVLKYVFLCGSRCNSGAILVLEKVDSHWTGRTKRPCSFILNNDNPRQ